MSPAEMPAGRETDALIAEKVFGEKYEQYPEGSVARGDGMRFRPLNVGPIGGPMQLILGGPLPFSTDMAAAWTVVERVRGVAPTRFKNLSLVAYCYHRTYATFDAAAFADYSPETWAEANGEHATPLAICLAALTALGPFDTRDTLSAVREAETECHAEEATS